MAENGAHFSGEGHLIEGQIEDDPNKTIRPIVCDADGHLIIDLDASTITIGTVDQGASGTDPWSIKIDQTGTNNDVDATITNFPANQDVTVTNGSGAAAVNIQDGGNSITVDGTVGISGSVVVTGLLTNAELRASPVPISGTVTATPSGTQDVNIISTIPIPVTDNGGSLTVDGTVAVSNFPVVQPVSGTVTTLQGTSPWVVSGTVITSPNVNVHDGTGVSISSTGSSLNVDVTNTVPVTLTSTTITGNVTVVQPTGTNLHTVVDSGSISITGTPNVNVTNGAGASAVNIQDGGNSITVDGTVAATQSGTWNINNITGTVSLPTGAATAALQTQPGVDIGDVTVNNAAGAAAVNIQDGGNSITVDGVFFQATQPVSLTSTTITGSVAVTGPLTDTQLRASPVPISGTVTANLGTVDGLALDATLTNSTQKTQIVQGGNTAVVDATGDLQVDVNNFPASQTINGTVTANQGTPNTTPNRWPVQITDGTDLAQVTGAGALQVDGSAVTQPVSGTVAVTQSTSPWVVSGTVTANAGTGTFAISAVSLPLPTGAATSANQSTQIASLASIDAGIPAALGQTTMAASMPVVIASDQSILNTRVSSNTTTSYSAATSAFALALLATDVFTITGSATKTIKIVKLQMSGTSAVGTVTSVNILKRSTANTLGTSTTLTNVAMDSTNAAATATIRSYTANPTLGTLVGNIDGFKFATETVSPTNPANLLVPTVLDLRAQPIVLRGITEVLAINFGGITLGTGNLAVCVEWTEE